MSELIDKATKILSVHEGYRQMAYKDSRGILTVGYGRNLQSKGLSKSEAYYLLDNDVQESLDSMLNLIPWFSSLSINRQVVLIDISVNAGFRGLLLFKKFLSYLQSGQYKLAAGEIRNSNAYKSLTNRYESLARIIETDIYENF